MELSRKLMVPSFATPRATLGRISRCLRLLLCTIRPMKTLLRVLDSVLLSIVICVIFGGEGEMFIAIVTVEGKNGLVKLEVDGIMQRKVQRITIV